MTDIQKKLFALQNKKYAEFKSKLTPAIDSGLFIGVRVPECRKLAKEQKHYLLNLVSKQSSLQENEYE